MKMSNAPLTPPATENDLQLDMPTNQPPAEIPAVEPVPAVAAPSEPPRQRPTAYQQLFPTLANFSVQGQYLEVINAAEAGDLNTDGEWDETRFLVTTPLVLSYLTIDDLPPAHYALTRLPEILTTHPLYKALLSLLAVTWDRSYTKVYRYAEQLIGVVQHPGFFDASLATLVKGLTENFIDAFRRRVLALLSKSYSSLPLALAQSYLDLPTDMVLTTAQGSNWLYDSSTKTFTPSIKLAPTNRSYFNRHGSSLSTFNRVADGTAKLESVL